MSYYLYFFAILQHNMTMLLQAAYKGNYEMCEFLLNHGSDVNITTHKNLYTPLMMAAIAGLQLTSYLPSIKH